MIKEDEIKTYSMKEFMQPCIYLLIRESYWGSSRKFIDRKYNVVYVGQSKRGIERAFEHKDKEFDYIKVIPCKLSQLNDMEEKYIKEYNPIYNNQKKNRNIPSGCMFTYSCDNCKYASNRKTYDTDEKKGDYIHCKKDHKEHNYYNFCDNHKYYRNIDRKNKK